MNPGSAAAPQPWWREPTREQWIAFAAAWVGWILDAFDFTVFLLVMPAIGKEFGVTITATAWSVTLTLLFRLMGGYLAGLAADRWGRKLPLMISIIWFAVCDGAVAMAPSFTFVLVLRTIFGLGMGAEWTAGATLAMENWPARSRGIASGILQGSWAVGYLFAALIAGFVVPRFGWRALFLVAALPALMALPIRAFVPESKDWKEHAAKAEKSWRDLLAPGLVKQMAWGSLVMALGFGGYYGLTALYTPLLTKELHFTANQVFPMTAFFNVGMLVGATAWGALAARRGPILAILLPAVMVVPLTPLYVGMAPGMAALMVGAVVAGALGGGYAGVTPLLLTSLFPVHVRARCVGIVYHVGALLAAFAPPFMGWLHESRDLTLGQSILLVAGGSNLLLALALIIGRNTLAPVGEAETAAAPALH